MSQVIKSRSGKAIVIGSQGAAAPSSRIVKHDLVRNYTVFTQMCISYVMRSDIIRESAGGSKTATLPSPALLRKRQRMIKQIKMRYLLIHNHPNRPESGLPNLNPSSRQSRQRSLSR